MSQAFNYNRKVAMKYETTLSRRFCKGICAALAALGAAAAAANPLIGKDSFICTAWHAMSCSTADACKSTEAWQLNIPDFVKVDLDARSIGTLPGDEDSRSTQIESVARRDGKVFMNGSQEDRGFTWVINEESGEGTLSIASDTTVIALFTVCAATDDI